ncbi:FkbM family methyltransferase [Roseibium aggregatum]|uniref:FkbM family methyltransferase n=1 Tax=Roseibium aggregatum TaxID=187304 RepID=A0A939EJG0_9HYPH|nr:FkbM family methyltransferase [Roseibium aggregatum]MBN9674073.1 FkbM family methyltransferase [Roseibium aggregatum]
MFSNLINALIMNSDPFLEMREELSLIGQYFRENPPELVVGSGAMFYLPGFWRDPIQREIFKSKNYFDFDELRTLDRYVPDEAVILDIGANIGNHSLYWGVEREALRIHAFEPSENRFRLLEKIVEANQLQDCVKLHNLGVAGEPGRASCLPANRKTGTSTRLRKDEAGPIRLLPLDSVELDLESLDLIKVDADGFELEALAGARDTIEKFSPAIVVRAVGLALPKVDHFLSELNYRREENIGWSTYVYTRAVKAPETDAPDETGATRLAVAST